MLPRNRPSLGPRPELEVAAPLTVLDEDERIGAVIDVEQRALRTLEQDARPFLWPG